MLAELTSHQFAEWIAYASLDPWGEERADVRMGILASLIANANRGKNQKPYKPEDFIPRYEPETEEEAQQRLMAQAMRALGGKR